MNIVIGLEARVFVDYHIMSGQDRNTTGGHVMREDYGSRVVGLSQLAELSTSLITNAIGKNQSSFLINIVKSSVNMNCSDATLTLGLFPIVSRLNF